MAQSGPDSDSVETTDNDSAAEEDGEWQSGLDSDSVETTDSDPSVEEDGEWQFGLDDVGPDGIVEEEPEPIEPGHPKLENVVFILLGVVGTLFLLSTVI